MKIYSENCKFADSYWKGKDKYLIKTGPYKGYIGYRIALRISENLLLLYIPLGKRKGAQGEFVFGIDCEKYLD